MEKNFLITTISNNNIEFIKDIISKSELIENSEILIIDDESDYDIIEELHEFGKVKCIKNEKKLGIGGCLNTAINYFKNFDYDYLILLNCNSKESISDFSCISSNLEYGYDLVSCSRILENFNYDKMDPETIEITEGISETLNNVISETVTDPLSFNKGISRELATKLDITENNSNAMLQLFIQANYFGSTMIEIPSESELSLGEELIEDGLLQDYYNVIESEKYLYNKGTLN